MALLFMDGMSHYSTTAIMTSGKWTALTSGSLSTTAGRFGGGDFRFTGGSAHLDKLNVVFGDNTAILGFAWKTAAVGTTPTLPFIELTTTTNGPIELFLNNDGTVAIRRNGTVLATTTNALANGVWYFIELFVIVSATVGQYQLQVNGVDWIALSAANKNTSTGPATGVILRQCSSSTTNEYCDLRLQDGTGGGALAAMLGDTRIETLLGTGAGNKSQWVPSASTNVSNIDDTSPDSDTTYNSETTVNDIDSFAFADLATTSGTVFAVQHNLWARKTDAGTRQLAPLTRQGGTDYVHTTVTLATSYMFYCEIKSLDPAAGAWTIANVNADEFGYKFIA